jgi:hypothetical protein
LNDRRYTLHEAAQVAGVGYMTIRRAVHEDVPVERRLRCYSRMGSNRKFVYARDFMAWMDARSNKPDV